MERAGVPDRSRAGAVTRQQILALLVMSPAAYGVWHVPPATTQGPAILRGASGLQVLAVAENTQPAIRIVLPGHATSDRSIEVLFPEHVTAVRHGSAVAEQLYRFRPGSQEAPPAWRLTGQSIEYRRDVAANLHLLARATVEEDGVRFRYEFTNGSSVAYDMIYAVTDPRLTGVFHDVRLERTYVHHRDGFDLLASETPGRLTMPLTQWLPARYLVSFTWPVPPQRVEHRGDGITYYNKSRAVDEPFIATLSTDRAWVIASVARNVGNVWSNPELTCQHVDPQSSLAPGEHVERDVKLLVVHGTLDDALQRALGQRGSLK
jgi:hypothetical protein